MILFDDGFIDEDFTPSFRNVLLECEMDDNMILHEMDSIIHEIESIDGQIPAELLPLLRFRVEFHRFAIDLDSYIFTTISITSRTIREKKSHSKIIQSTPEYPDTKEIATHINALLSRCDSLLQLSKLPDGIPAALQFLFRPYLTKLNLTGPAKTIKIPTFHEGAEWIRLSLEKSLMVHEILTVWTTALSDNESTAVKNRQHGMVHTVFGEKVLTWDYLFQLSMHLSQLLQPFLLSRCFYAAVLHGVAFNLDLSLAASFEQRGIPSKLIEQEIVSKEWLIGNFYVLCWDILKSFCILRLKIFSSTRIQHILQATGHVVNESFIVDEQIKKTILENDGGKATSDPVSTNLHDSVNLCAWFTTYTAAFATFQMDWYVQLMIEMNLIEFHELDYFFWYWDYIYSTQIHALDKLRAGKLQFDINRYEDYKHKLLIYEEDQQKVQSKVNKKKSKHGKSQTQPINSKMPPAPVPSPEVILPYAEDVLRRGKTQLCRGIFRLVLCLKQLNLFPLSMKSVDRKNDYVSKDLVFMKRFGALQEIMNPAYLTFRDFIDTINKDGREKKSKALNLVGIDSSTIKNETDDVEEETIILDVKNIIQGANICFQTAKNQFDDARKYLQQVNSSTPNNPNVRPAPSIFQLSHAKNIAALTYDQALQLLKVIPVCFFIFIDFYS
jgi:hypothetical protein